MTAEDRFKPGSMATVTASGREVQVLRHERAEDGTLMLVCWFLKGVRNDEVVFRPGQLIPLTGLAPVLRR